MTAINTGFLYNEISSRICRIEPVFFYFCTLFTMRVRKWQDTENEQ